MHSAPALVAEKLLSTILSSEGPIRVNNRYHEQTCTASRNMFTIKLMTKHLCGQKDLSNTVI